MPIEVPFDEMCSMFIKPATNFKLWILFQLWMNSFGEVANDPVFLVISLCWAEVVLGGSLTLSFYTLALWAIKENLTSCHCVN